MGTRFLTYVQSPDAGKPFNKPELLEIDLSSVEIQPGPADKNVYVLDAVKGRYPNLPGPHAYDPDGGPPWGGAVYPAVQPGPGGHFDHLRPGTREFAAASVYATVRFVLALWEKYFAQAKCDPIKWYRAAGDSGLDPRLEINPWSIDDGARAGYGFIEFGTGIGGGHFNANGPVWQNFDVVAHELGHAILFGRMGFPKNMSRKEWWYSPRHLTNNRDFLAFHESAGDLSAIVSCLHHNTVVKHVLKRAGGNMRAQNVVNSIGELGKHIFIRHAKNDLKLADFKSVKPADLDIHRFSQVLTGAVYEAFVDYYDTERKNQMPPEQALLSARDWLGQTLAKAWSELRPDGITFKSVRDALVEADTSPKQGMAAHLVERFKERGIY